MQTHARFRLSRLAVATTALAVAFSVSVVDAGAKRSCKFKKEQSGCKLKAGAGYTAVGDFAKGLPIVRVFVSQSFGRGGAKTVSLANFSKAQTTCSDGIRHGLTGQFTIRNGRVKVGKSYKINITDKSTQSDTSTTRTYKGKVKIKSRKRVSFDVDYAELATFPPNSSNPSGKLACSVKVKRTLKRD